MRGRNENRLAITRVVQVSNNSCGPKNHLDLYLDHLDTPSKCLRYLPHHCNQHQFTPFLLLHNNANVFCSCKKTERDFWKTRWDPALIKRRCNKEGDNKEVLFQIEGRPSILDNRPPLTVTGYFGA